MSTSFLNRLVFAAREEKEDLTVLREDVAEEVAMLISAAMPDDANIEVFTAMALNQIAAKMEEILPETSVKVPTAQELIEYTGEFNDAQSHNGYHEWASIINKLANCRYDLSDFADIIYDDNDKSKIQRIVITAAYKGKLLYINVQDGSYMCDLINESHVLKILKKCTMH